MDGERSETGVCGHFSSSEAACVPSLTGHVDLDRFEVNAFYEYIFKKYKNNTSQKT